MSSTLVRKSQIRPLNIVRSDINTTTSGSALITKIIAGTGLTLSSSTGVNPGTGDVTVALSIATASTLGGVKIGSGLTVAVDGTISVNSVSTTWGSITGLLSNQNDLQAALNAKYNIPTGTSSQYIDGTGALQTFPSALATGYVRHEVKAGVPIIKGQAVYVRSSDGTNMIVELASYDAEQTSSKTMGLLDRTVSTNGFANVITEGLLAGLDTTAAQAGDPVWLGPSGNLLYGIANKPHAPFHMVFIGIVTRVNANNGEIFVKVQNGYEIDELHDVLISGAVGGQLLRRDDDGLWKNWTPNYLTSFTETDPTVPAHVKAITTTNISNWNTAYSWGNHATQGYLTSVTNISGYAGTLLREDNRTISPSELAAGQMKFGFTSWNNNNTSPYADFIHMRSYTDASGGTDNLVMFLKNGIGMRIWQQTWGSTSPYAEYVDVWTTGNFTQTNVNNWNTAYSWGNHSSQGYATQTYVNTAIANLVDTAPGTLDTLNELAAALGDDPNFATTVTNNIATKVSKSGDTMTGNLNWAQTDRGITWGFNTDGAYIKFFNTGDGDTDSRLEYATSDNGDEYHRWMISGSEEMTLKFDGLRVRDSIWMGGNLVATQSWVGSQGYITGYTESDPTVPAHVKAITTTNISNWNTAYGWGNHASAGYIVAGSTVAETASWTGATKFRSSGDISNSGASNHSLQVYADLNNDAYMAFHISSDFAVYFGLENATNRLYTGGWSEGATKYQIWDSRDFSSTNISNWNTAYGWGNHASVGYLTSLPSHNHDGVYVPINPDNDGPSWQYSDENPTINGTYIGGRQSFGADGDALTGGALQARLLNAYDGHVNSAYGYYVGNLNYGGDSGTHSTTQVIDSSGKWVGLSIGDAYISSASNWNTAYNWGNHAAVGYLTSLPSHTHDDRYYTESESDARFLRYYGVNAESDFQRFQDGVGEIRFDQINDYNNLSNAPGGYNYGGVLSMRGDNFGFQIWGSHTGDLYYKTQWSGDNYTGWRSIITTLNIGSQSVNYANSAGSVAWSNVTGRPTALSQFTNDLGNYGNWITASALSGYATQAWVQSQGYITGSYIPAGGSWMADFASYGFTRQIGISYTGGEWVVLTKDAQISTLIDGSYFAGENGGFYSLNTANNYTSRKGFYNDGTYANFNTSVYVTGDIVNSSAIYPGFNNGTTGNQTSYYLYGNTSNTGIRTNGNFLVNGDIYLGVRGQWLSTYLNQNVRTDSSPSFSSVYLGGSQITGSMVNGLSNMLGVTTLPYSCDIIVNGDPDRFYAVQFWGGDQDVWRRIIIKRGYSEQAPWDPIGTGVHHGGLLLDWEGNFGGWGGAEYADRLRVFNESYTNVCADMFIYSHSMGYVFMLRGGGAIYHLFSDQAINGFYQSGSPDILYSSSSLSYDDTWSGTNQYDVYAPAPLSLAQVNSSRIDGLRTKKQSLLDARYARIDHTHDLMRYSLRAPGNVDSLTSSNFRDQLFGTSSNGWTISTARWNSVPSGLSGMNMYGTMFAWSGSDTHGFIATDYSTANIQVGGGSGNAITWKATLIHSGNIGSYALTSYTETDTLATVTARGATTSTLVALSGKVTLGNRTSASFNGNVAGLTINNTAEIRSTGSENPPALTWHYEGIATRHIVMTSAGVINVVSPSTENSGVAVLAVNGNTVLHAGNYTSYAVPTSRTITINGVSYDLSANRSWTVSGSDSTKLPLAGGTMSGTVVLHSISGVEQTVPNNYGAYLHLGAWGVDRTDARAVLVNTAYRADYADSLFDMNISRFTNNSGYITSSALSSYLPLSGGTLTGATAVSAGSSFVSNGLNNNGGFAMNNASTYWGLMWNYASNDWRLGRGSQTAQNGWNLRWDASDNVYTNGTLNANYFRNGSVWINNGADNNSYNENIRLFNAPNGVSVIAFSASGTSGTPTTSILGYSDRMEFRYGNGQQFRIYDGYTTTAGTAYAAGYRGNANVGGTGEASWHPAGIYSGSTQWLYGHTYRNSANTYGQGQIYFDSNYGYGLVGLYSSTRYQAIFAMGDSYKLPVDGTSTGSLYGLAWSHPNAGGVASNLNTHGLLVMENGTFLAAISGSIRARDDVRAPALYDSGSRVAISRGEGRNFVDYSRYVYNNGAYSGSGWVEPSDLGVRYASSAGSSSNSDRLYPFGAAIDSTHPGYGLRAWYDWAYSGTYRNGISLGSNPGDQAYGWQLWQNMWDDRTYTRRYNGGWQSTRTLMTAQDDPYAYNMNQYVRTSDDVTFRNIYLNGWFRNNNSREGLYNQANGNHFYSRGGSEWVVTGNGGNIELQFWSNHESARRGYVYANTSNEIGFLNSGGSWSLRCDNSGNVTATGDLTAYSDARIKTNIKTYENALEKVLQLRGVTYNRTDNNDHSEKIGVIAQEIEKIIPQVVSKQEDGLLTVSYGNIVGVLIEAIKEQQKEIEVLKSKLN